MVTNRPGSFGGTCEKRLTLAELATECWWVVGTEDNMTRASLGREGVRATLARMVERQ